MTSKSEFRRLVRDEGVPAAFNGLMRVLQDPKASATALASASRTMLEAAGVLKAPDEDVTKQPHEMTAAELDSEIRRLRKAGQSRSEDDLFD
ncbi:MAG TPA: hypothetical protein VIL30_16800 [Ramlibacter sp.]|jgi:hypothetical protein